MQHIKSFKQINEDNIKTLFLKELLNKKINISLADFDTFCHKDDYYTCEFGTQYYQAPEIILLGRCSFPVDIWAIGVITYELMTE